jgi:virginiamycin B lyase
MSHTISNDSSTPPSHVRGIRPRHWWLVALLVIVVLLAGGTLLTWQFVVVPQLSCSKSADVSRSGAMTEFCFPYNVQRLGDSMTAGPDGNLWFNEENKIGRMSPRGDVQEFALPQGSGVVENITAGPDGNIWFSESIGHGRQDFVGVDKIAKMTPSGHVTEFSLPFPGQGPRDVTFKGVLGLAPGSDGNVWFVEGTYPIAAIIGRITPAGQFTEFPVAGDSSSLEALTTGPDGNVWFIDVNGLVGRITPAGAIKLFQVVDPRAVDSVAIGMGPDGNVWFSVQRDKIVRITPSGVMTQFPLPHTGDVTGITAGPDGGVWFLLNVREYDFPAVIIAGNIRGTRIVRVTP